jgi:hypothetical protein
MLDFTWTVFIAFIADMENETKLALFVGGNADGWTKEINETEITLKMARFLLHI